MLYDSSCDIPIFIDVPEGCSVESTRLNEKHLAIVGIAPDQVERHQQSRQRSTMPVSESMENLSI